jgi:hypothetical protein
MPFNPLQADFTLYNTYFLKQMLMKGVMTKWLRAMQKNVEKLKVGLLGLYSCT